MGFFINPLKFFHAVFQRFTKSFSTMYCIILLFTLIFVSPTNGYNILSDKKLKKMKTNSKTLNWITKGSIVLAFSVTAFFAKANNGNEHVASAEKTIKEHVKFPNLILPVQKTEKVEVIFTTAENGKVNFVLAKTDNLQLKQIIEKQFTGLLLNQLKANEAYSIVFNFKTL
jgi:hypothetical protein